MKLFQNFIRGLALVSSYLTTALAGSIKNSGAEVAVNTWLSNAQTTPSIAGFSQGGSVVAWQSQYQNSNAWTTHGRAYALSGVATGDERTISTNTQVDETSVVMTVDPILNDLWSAFVKGGNTVMLRHFSNAFLPQALDFQVSLSSNSASPVVAANNGAVAVAYTCGANICFRVLLNGQLQPGEYTISADAFSQTTPKVILAGGNILVAYSRGDGSICFQSCSTTGSCGAAVVLATGTLSDFSTSFAGYSIVYDRGTPRAAYQQDLDGSGNLLGSEQSISVGTNDQYGAKMSYNSANNVTAIVWNCNTSADWDVCALVNGNRFRANAITVGDQTQPVVLVTNSSVTIAFTSTATDSSGDIGRRTFPLASPSDVQFFGLNAAVFIPPGNFSVRSFLGFSGVDSRSEKILWLDSNTTVSISGVGQWNDAITVVSAQLNQLILNGTSLPQVMNVNVTLNNVTLTGTLALNALAANQFAGPGNNGVRIFQGTPGVTVFVWSQTTAQGYTQDIVMSVNATTNTPLSVPRFLGPYNDFNFQIVSITTPISGKIFVCSTSALAGQVATSLICQSFDAGWNGESIVQIAVPQEVSTGLAAGVAFIPGYVMHAMVICQLSAGSFPMTLQYADSAGSPVGFIQPVNQIPQTQVRPAKILVLPSGNHMIYWSGDTDLSGTGIFIAMVTTTQTIVKTQTGVNTNLLGDQINPEAISIQTPTGATQIWICWEGPNGISLRGLDETGTPLSATETVAKNQGHNPKLTPIGTQGFALSFELNGAIILQTYTNTGAFSKEMIAYAGPAARPVVIASIVNGNAILDVYGDDAQGIFHYGSTSVALPIVAAPTPTPSVLATATPTSTPTPAQTSSAASATPTTTSTPAQTSAAASATATSTPTPSATATPIASSSGTPSNSQTPAPSASGIPNNNTINNSTTTPTGVSHTPQASNISLINQQTIINGKNSSANLLLTILAIVLGGSALVLFCAGGVFVVKRKKTSPVVTPSEEVMNVEVGSEFSFTLGIDYKQYLDFQVFDEKNQEIKKENVFKPDRKEFVGERPKLWTEAKKEGSYTLHILNTNKEVKKILKLTVGPKPVPIAALPPIEKKINKRPPPLLDETPIPEKSEAARLSLETVISQEKVRKVLAVPTLVVKTPLPTVSNLLSGSSSSEQPVSQPVPSEGSSTAKIQEKLKIEDVAPPASPVKSAEERPAPPAKPVTVEKKAALPAVRHRVAENLNITFAAPTPENAEPATLLSDQQASGEASSPSYPTGSYT